MNKMILTAGPSITQKEIDYVTDAVTNGIDEHWGDYINRFEKAFAEYIGVNHAITTSSCTGALHLALVALGIKRGDEVIVPDMSWIATASAVCYAGATAVLTFDNYYVNGFKREGTITWTNVSTPGHRSWTRQVVAGKITAPNGHWWLHNSLKTITQIHGMATLNPEDDAFETTGAGTVVNSNNVTRTYTILEALVTKNSCPKIVSGRLKVEGPNHYAIINYGNGACDNIATISIDGGNPFPIQLP